MCENNKKSMSRPEKIPTKQKERIYRLENIVEVASKSGNLEKAKLALDDLNQFSVNITIMPE